MPLLSLASPTGGVGRTVLAAQLASVLTRLGERVVAIDLDPQNALGVQFGVDLADAFGFMATLRYAEDPRTAWRAALRSSPSGASFLPFGQVGLEGAVTVAQALAERPEMLTLALADMLAIDDVLVIVDLPAGASLAMAAVLPYTDLLLVPVLPDPASIAQIRAVEAGRFAGGARGIDPQRISFVLNRSDAPGAQTWLLADSLRQHLGARLAGEVRHDDMVIEALLARRLVVESHPQANAARDIVALAVSLQQRLKAHHLLRLHPSHAMAALAAFSPLSRSHAAQEFDR